jgi:hypothetical protein
MRLDSTQPQPPQQPAARIEWVQNAESFGLLMDPLMECSRVA